MYSLPLSLDNMNKMTFTPVKDYAANRLKTGILQIPDRCHLILDETALQPGQLNEHGKSKPEKEKGKREGGRERESDEGEREGERVREGKGKAREGGEREMIYLYQHSLVFFTYMHRALIQR